MLKRKNIKGNFLIMKKYILATFFLSACLSQIAYGQKDFQSQFKVLFEKNDIAGQEKLLQKWEKEKPDDAELYVSYFNFYLNKSRQENLSLNSKPQSKDSLKITKEDDKNVVAYLGTEVSYEKKDFDKAIEYISKGIEKFPNRLDMRFGKTAAFGRIEDYESFTNELVKAIDYSNINKNQWLWLNGKPIENPQKMFLSTVQDYFVQIYETGDKNTNFLKQIAEAVLKYYPDNVENLSNLAIYYMLKEDYDNALTPLLKAEKLAPTDFIVIGNIAWAYFLKNDKKNSLKYYELLLKYGDKAAQNQAKEKIAELKK